MDKIVVVVTDGPTGRAERRRVLLDQVAPDVVSLGARRLQLCVADEAADVPGPTPFRPGDVDPVALLSVWIDEEALTRVIERLEAAGFGAHAWRVSSDVYTDYGEHPAWGRRDWPDGQRSPTVTSVNFLERPASIPLETWLERWRGRMSPVSAELQPRVRYVRNLLEAPLTEGAPGWQAIVEEVWPSPRHVSSKLLFFGASNPFTLAVHMSRVLAAVMSFLRPWRVLTVMMSEYFVLTDGQGVPRERRPDGTPR